MAGFLAVTWAFEFWMLLQSVVWALLFPVLCPREYLGTPTLQIGSWRLYSILYIAGRLPKRTSVLFCFLWDSLYIKQQYKSRQVRGFSCPVLTQLPLGAQQKSLSPAPTVDLFF